MCAWPPSLKCVFSHEQMKPGLQIPSPAELMGKILIKNKKGSHGKPSQACPKKTEESEQPIVTASAGQEPNQTGPTNPEDQCVTGV